MKEFTVWMAMSGLNSMRNVPLVVSTLAKYFLSALMVISGRSGKVMGVGGRPGDGLAAVVGVDGWPPSPSQARASTPRSREMSRRGQARIINGLQSVLGRGCPQLWPRPSLVSAATGALMGGGERPFIGWGRGGSVGEQGV